jgi:hypothetical protein
MGIAIININSKSGAYSFKGNSIPVSTDEKIPVNAVAKWFPKKTII